MNRNRWQRLFNVSLAVAAVLLAVVWAIGFARGDPGTTAGRMAAFVLMLTLPVLAVLITPGGNVAKFIVAALVFVGVDAATVYAIPLHDELFLGEHWGFIVLYLLGAGAYWWWYKRSHPGADGTP